MTDAVAGAALAPGASGTAARSWAIPPGLVAVVAIALAALAFIHTWPSGRAAVVAVFFATLVVLTAIDLEQRRIPNRIVVPAGVVILAGDLAASPGRAEEWVVAAFAMLLGASVLGLLSRGGIGMGDAKLCFLLGAGLGWSVLGALVYAMFAVFVAAAVILVRRGVGARKDSIPLCPFLTLGAVVSLFLS